MNPRKFRWSKVYESSEEELTDFLRSRGVSAKRHTAAEFAELEPQIVEKDTTIWCAEGSLSATAAITPFSIQPGDALHLPAGTTVVIRAGMTGAVYYETIA